MMHLSLKVKVPRWLLLCAVLLLSLACHGQTNCPWLNAATAVGILGNPVKETVTHAKKNSDDATCDFAPQQSSVGSTLHIAVITMSNPGQEFAAYKQQCGSQPVPLQAIGNEAIECTLDICGGQSAQVVGRVRDRVFIVNLHGPMVKGTASPLAEQLKKARDVAEQVSGSLY